MSKIFTAREVLTYLYAESTKWNEDVDGDIDNGRAVVYINHHISIRDGLLEELLDMAGIKRAHDESCLDALKRANDDDTPAEAYIYDQTVPPMHE
jgi:hypothetical protein